MSLLQVERLQGAISKLNAENVQYRDNNKTQQFETRIQELEQKLQQTGGCNTLPSAFELQTSVLSLQHLCSCTLFLCLPDDLVRYGSTAV